MSVKSTNEFIVDNGCLKKYVGKESVVTIPANVLYIGAEAFKNNKCIKKIIFSSHVLIVGKNAFHGCPNLAEVELNEELMIISECAFKYCPISSIVIPNKVQVIESGAFEKCSELNSFILTNSNTLIEVGAFWDTNLKFIDIEVNGKIEKIDIDKFNYKGLTCKKYGVTEEFFDAVKEVSFDMLKNLIMINLSFM